MAKTQEHREASIGTPLGDDVLLLTGMTADEELGRLFQYELELVSENLEIKAAHIVGENVTIRLRMRDQQTRCFNGYLSRFVQQSASEREASYHATVVPWLWFLTRTADCRVFQETTVPDIIKKVFRDRGFTDFEDRLTGSYRTWEYCVQYRETDFNFVSRLMEQEGIYYFFVHEDGKHMLVLADSPSVHEPYGGYEQISCQFSGRPVSGEEYISDWTVETQIQPGAYALNDFDFKNTRKDLKARARIQRDHSKADYEVYDYPGEYVESSDAERCARTRIEELHAQYEVVTAGSDARGLAAGHTFALTGHPRDDQNRQYLVTSAHFSVDVGEFQSGGGGDRSAFSCSFTAIDASRPFRTRQTTPKPSIPGPQTAMVVGPAGEEIYTDEHGRVKVQFHWDRYGKSDEKSSCWIRVAQIWAGKKWGGVFLPRIGQEVIVEFLEGDPDRPIVTGRVYNGQATPPYDLPMNKTQSGVKSRSSKGGGPDNFNEIRFEDKKGAEQLYIHAEKNEDIVVENCKTESVGNNETIDIGNNRTETVGKNEDLSVGENRTRQVGKNETITIGEDRDRQVGGNETIDIGKNQTRTVGENEAVTVGDSQSIKVGKDRSVTIGKNDNLDVGKNLVINAGEQILVKTGKASILMKKDGTVVISGKDITLKGSGAITVKASKDVVIKGKKILEN